MAETPPWHHRITTVQSTILARLSIWVWAGYAIFQGAGICFGGPERWTSAAYAQARQLPGSPYSWGIILTAFGLLAMVGSLMATFRPKREEGLGLCWWLKAAGLGGICAWSLCFSFSAFSVTIANPLVGTTIGPVYLGVAFASAVLIFVNERSPAHAA